jgi:hypothetical protein
MNAPRAAWREPMVWLVAALPAATVVAGFLLLDLAGRDRSDAVAEPVRRIAQVQQADLAADRRAAAAGLEATLEIERATGAVEVAFGMPGAWTLALAHPIDARRDRHVPLDARNGTLHGSAGPIDAAPYTATLESRDGAWRLAGRIARGGSRARLSPRLAP